ncbi:6-phosphogluconolactonase [Maricurvus nonylphenolicus]|uniref:6-phosphogluconolactonase n=1 Tax=Maricurvus nonylphenolicus TaxID=1008307 RepID=UPI0036F32202
MSICEFKFSSREQMLNALYEHTLEILETGIKHNAQVSLFLSGGSTPGPLYKALAEAPLDWEKVAVALVDERWVAADHNASNEKLIGETLLAGTAQPIFTGMKNAADTATDGLTECENAYRALPEPYAVSLLGMGPDGHTASLFPYAEGLADALDTQNTCAAIYPTKSDVTGEYVERMSMTPSALLNSQRLILIITGDDKWDVYQQAKRAEDVQAMPVALFLQQDKTPIDVYWAP